MTNEGALVSKFQIEFFSEVLTFDPRDNGEMYMGRWDICQMGEPTHDYAHTLSEALDIAYEADLDYDIVPVIPSEQRDSRRWNRFYNSDKRLYEFDE